MNGLVYLLDQAGTALAQANQRILELEAEVQRLTSNKEQSSPTSG